MRGTPCKARDFPTYELIAPVTSVDVPDFGEPCKILAVNCVRVFVCVWFDPLGTTNGIRASGGQNAEHDTCSDTLFVIVFFKTAINHDLIR